MEIFINQTEYLATSQTAGIMTLIHDFNATIFPDNEGNQIPVGYSAAMAVQKIDIKRLGPPYGKCIKDVGNRPFYYNTSYSIEVRFKFEKKIENLFILEILSFEFSLKIS